MADSDSLIEGRGTVKKNIQWFIGGLIAIVIVIAIFAQDAGSKKHKADQAKEPEKIPQADANPESIKGALNQQKAVVINGEADIANNNKPGVPAIVTTGVGKDPKQTEILTEKEAQAVEDSRREAQLNGSSIMAISPDSNRSENLSALKPSLPEINKIAVDENDLRKALAAPTINTEVQSTQKATTKEVQDQTWQKEQGSKAKSIAIVEDDVNSPYTVFEGAVIPAVLMTKVTSQLPGQITGVVSQDVYDGVSGRHLIIPKGSTVYGTYNNSVTQGQSRLMVSFTRLILPNGRTVSLLGMPSADKVGQHGIEGDVDNRYLKRFGFSFLTAVLGTIVDKNNTSPTTVINTGGAGSGVTSAAGTVLVQMSQAEQQRTAQIQPIITLKQGEKFNINVNRDIAIKPYY